MKFSNIPPFLDCHDVQIAAKRNEHTVCRVLFEIDPDKEDAFLSLAQQRTETEVTSDSGDRILSGKVTQVTVNNETYTATTAEVLITSGSLEVQEEGENRIYQDPRKTYADILKNYPKVETGQCEHLQDTVEEIIYQYRMDDFTFLQYLAQKCETSLWIADDGKVSFGSVNSQKQMEDSTENVQQGVLSRSRGADKHQQWISFLSMEQLPNGGKINYHGTEYTICQTEIHEEYNMPYFRYTASTAPSCHDAVIYPLDWISAAEVTDNKDPENLGRIQVKFTEFTDEASERTWLPYSTVYVGTHQGGVVMLPDQGDHVLVAMSSGKASVLGSVREVKLPDNCQDVAKKYFAMNETLITLDDTMLLAEQGKKSKMKITEDSLTEEHDKVKKTLDEKAVTITADSSRMMIATDAIQSEIKASSWKMDQSGIQAKNGNGVLTLKNASADLAGKGSSLSLNNGKTKLSGSNIDFNTQGVSL